MSAEELEDKFLAGDELGPLLRSLRFFKAQYKHEKDPSQYCYAALRRELSCIVWFLH